MIADLVSHRVTAMCPADASVHPNWRLWWPAHAERIAADMRARLPAAIAAWDLRRLTPLTGGEVALVFAAASAYGDAVLKLSPRVAGETDELAAEPLALELWSVAGVAPRVHGSRDGGHTVLMERVRPGHNLRDAGAGALQIVSTLGRLCPLIHLAGQEHRFRRLRDGADIPSWRRQLAGTRERDELERLLEPADDDRLLHIDLHWLNALRGPAGWVVIDPKPLVGDPHAEVFGFFDGPPLETLADGRAGAREQLRRLTDAYARAAGLDRDRLEAWVRLRALVFAGQLDAEGGDAARRERLLRVADALI
jgi:streptomycin 6-kinase